MKQINIGRSFELPKAVTGSTGTFKKQSNASQAFFSGAMAIIGSILMLFCTGEVKATAIPTSTFSCTRPTTATTTCVNGGYASGWSTSGTDYWQYTLSTSGYDSIKMVFTTTSSGTGPTTAAVYYDIGGGEVFVTNYSVSTSCATKTVTFPAACNNQSALTIRIKMNGASGTGGTNRMPSNGGFDGHLISASCTGTPVGGSVSASASSYCGSGAPLLSLSGASGGTGITYQWQQSTTSPTSGFANIAGANGITYTVTPAITTTTYYRAITKCTASGDSSFSTAATVTINPLPAVSPITGVSNPELVGITDTLYNATPGGVWKSGTTSVATIDSVTGILNPVWGGTTLISYVVTNPSTGCTNSATASVNVVWPNTLALYAGFGGNSTNVIAIPGETTGTLTAYNFGTPNTLCSSGGLSGLTVPVATTSYSTAGPRVSYVIRPNAGNALNINRIHAVTRESGTGPAKARIAYRINGGTWMDEGVDVAQSTGGSCGASSNSWDFSAGLTLTGITDSIEVAVFPFAPGASTGTFQLNSLEVYGTVTSAAACSGMPAAGIVTPSLVNICDSAARWLTFTGDAGVGISYQWEKSTTSATSGFSPIAGAINSSYNTGMLRNGVDGPVIYYRVVTKCAISGDSTFSAADTVTVNGIPSAGTIIAPAYVFVGVADTVNSTVPGGWWSSNYVNAVPVDSASGAVNPILPGIATLTYHVTVNGCTGVSRADVKSILPNTIAAYLGTSGTSSAVTSFMGAAGTVDTLARTGFGSNSACGRGGVSGLTNNGVFSYSPAGAHAYFTAKATSGNKLYINGFHTTLRRSASGIQNARLAYSLNGGATWTDEGANQNVDVDDCGYSHTDLYWSLANPVAADLPIGADSVTFAIYGFNPGAAGGVLQINTVDITGFAGNACGFPGDPIYNLTSGYDLDDPMHNRFEDCDATQNLDGGIPGGIFVSSNPAVASVTSNGALSFHTVGAETPVTISYVVSYGSCYGTYDANITVRPCGTPKPAAVSDVNKASDVQLYPNPATSVLNVKASEKVRVVVLSLDGKTLVDQKDAQKINVNNLSNGLYLIKVYNEKNVLVKTAKFTKQ